MVVMVKVFMCIPRRCEFTHSFIFKISFFPTICLVTNIITEIIVIF